MFIKRFLVVLVLLFVQPSMNARDVILEAKGAAFLPTDCIFKQIYGKKGGLFGAEVTFQLSECNECWYGFASVDYFQHCGRSIGLGDATKVKMVPLALGLKYFISSCYADFYVGLGFQPTHVKTINSSVFVTPCTSQWGMGGIAKVGAYFDLYCNWVLDIFVDYSFAKLDCKNRCPQNRAFVVPIKANVSGTIVGAGLGYRF